ncbi:unnamed protein product [Meloidogyne enterolobii]|uniref:Uncharacterized protein n=1 Tax=Meloidogyne enterolobii TaxID=390850 RepID=A0ACB1B5Z8_MELEN
MLYGNNEHLGLIYFAERIISLVKETHLKNTSNSKTEYKFNINLSEEVRKQLTKPLLEDYKNEKVKKILENIEKFLKIVKPKNIEKSIECLLETLGFDKNVEKESVEYKDSFLIFLFSKLSIFWGIIKWIKIENEGWGVCYVD